MVGKSARHIRNLCKEGRLPCQKMKISTGEKYLVYVDSEEFKELLQSKEIQGEIVESPSYGGNFHEEEEGSSSSDASAWHGIISDMTSKIELLAREAGKTELLTDTLMTSEQNVKFYQDEYFKIRHDLENTARELSSLKDENISLKNRVQELEKELENRSKPFWAKISRK